MSQEVRFNDAVEAEHDMPTGDMLSNSAFSDSRNMGHTSYSYGILSSKGPGTAKNLSQGRLVWDFAMSAAGSFCYSRLTYRLLGYGSGCSLRRYNHGAPVPIFPVWMRLSSCRSVLEEIL